MRINQSQKSSVDLIVPFGIAGIAFYMMYKRTGKYQESGIIALIVAAVGYIITSQITKRLVESTINNLSTAKQQEIATKYGVDTNTLQECKEVSDQVYIAFHGADGKAIFEDEDAAVNAINRCDTPEEVRTVCAIYNKTYNLSLASDFNKYCQGFFDGSWNKISALVKNNWF